MSANVLDGSFLRFSLAFSYDHHAHPLQELSARVMHSGGSPGPSSPLFWEPGPFPREGMIAHVGRFLNPPDDAHPPTARMWRLADASMRAPAGLGAQGEWSLVTPRGAMDIRVASVDLALFSFGVGFVSIEVTPKERSLEAWLDTLHYFRVADGRQKVGLAARRRTGRDSWEPYWPPCAGGGAAAPEGNGTIGAIFEGLLQSIAAPGEGAWWRHVFVPGLLLPYACVMVDCDGAREDAGILYRVRGFFHSHQDILPPTGWQAESPSLLPYAERQWHVFSLEGGAFVALDPPATPFFRENLPQRVRQEYWLLFILAQHQRFALVSLSERVAEAWLPSGVHSPAERQQVFATIQSDMLGFTARGFFSQVMQRENHHRAFRRWQEVLELGRLYDEVRDEVAAMHSESQLQAAQAEQRATRSVERFIRIFGLAIGVPSLMFSFLAMNASGIRDALDGASFWQLFVMALAAAGVGIGFALALGKRRDRR